MTRGQCPGGGVLVNAQEWGCFSIFWRADDVTRTMSKGVCVLVNVFTPPFRKSCIRACVPPIQVQTPPPPPGWLATGLVVDRKLDDGRGRGSRAWRETPILESHNVRSATHIM